MKCTLDHLGVSICAFFLLRPAFAFLVPGPVVVSSLLRGPAATSAAAVVMQPTNFHSKVQETALEALKIGIPFRSASVADAVATTAADAFKDVVFPSNKLIVAANLLPTCIGFYKYEYGVSYAYGTATAMTAFLALRALLAVASPSNFTSVAQLHATSILFYGIRLNSFLFYREFFNKRFRRMRERIEQRQTDKEKDTGWIGRVLNRTPFILSCSLLYAGLAAPSLISTKIIAIGATPICDMALKAYKVLVGLTWFGFSLGAIGDYTKSIVKSKKGPDHLVTGGVYRYFRHPNYTGEIIGWSASFLASIVATVASSSIGVGVGGSKMEVLKVLLPLLGLSSLGIVGILFVLFAATTNLEKRQEEKYGNTEDYKRWIKTSWSGPKLSSKEKTF
jgi:steroid 5-alpha reductase family enzyme